VSRATIILAKCDHCLHRSWWVKGCRWGAANPTACPECGKTLLVTEADGPKDSKFQPATEVSL
jgi:hypothetical protein